MLSGFVNPERSTLRSQALAMGATYQPDWNSDSTLLICAFPNTPKFRQVEINSGTIVSKVTSLTFLSDPMCSFGFPLYMLIFYMFDCLQEWITECYTQKKLVDIEQYLMHTGKPWRKSSVSQDAIRGKNKYIGKALSGISILTTLFSPEVHQYHLVLKLMFG